MNCAVVHNASIPVYKIYIRLFDVGLGCPVLVSFRKKKKKNQEETFKKGVRCVSNVYRNVSVSEFSMLVIILCVCVCYVECGLLQDETTIYKRFISR